MNEGSTIFAQLLAHCSRDALDRCIRRYDGNARVRSFSCRDQFLTMLFAQLTYRESLRDIEACLGALPERLYHMGIRGTVSRSTLADANERRSWRIYADYAQVLIAEARRLYANEPLDVALERTVYALDSSTIELCLSLFPWAKVEQAGAAVKLHTLLDLRGSIPVFAHVSGGRFCDLHVLEQLEIEPGSIYVMDRLYGSFKHLYRLHQARATFVVRARKNLRLRRIYSCPVDRSTGLLCDQIVVPIGVQTQTHYPVKLRKIRFTDRPTKHQYTYLTNDFTLSALTIVKLYKSRWRIELFFKWIKQHLRIKAFYGRSMNAVQTQIWIAICAYLLVAIVRKRLAIDRDLYTLLQILSVSLFEKTQLMAALSSTDYRSATTCDANQLLLLGL